MASFSPIIYAIPKMRAVNSSVSFVLSLKCSEMKHIGLSSVKEELSHLNVIGVRAFLQSWDEMFVQIRNNQIINNLKICILVFAEASVITDGLVELASYYHSLCFLM